MSLIKNIDITIQDFSLKIESLEIPDHGITVIQGPSGSGKTTFLRVLMGLIPANFEWSFKGENLAKLAPSERRLGVVFQGADLFPHMSVKENILFHARARKIPKTDYTQSLERLLNIAKLQGKAQQNVSTLSGGEMQRVALLRALSGKPRILLLDEPFSALDPELKSEIKDFVKKIVQKEQIPCLMVSHDQKDAEDLADFVILFKDGRVTNTTKRKKI